MKSLGSKIVGLTLLGLLLQVSKAHALVCPAPAAQPLGTAWCDADPTRYLADSLCVAEPIDGPPSSTIDEEVVGGGVCLLGKFKTDEALHGLVDLIASYDMLPGPGMTPEEILDLPTGIFFPDLEALAGSREFMTTIPLERDGAFDISIQATILDAAGSLQSISFNRRVLRVSEPHLTVTGARVGGAGTDCVGHPGDRDGDGICDDAASIPNVCTAGPDSVDDRTQCFGVSEMTGDSDGDGICDGDAPIPGLCSAGPDPIDDNGTEGVPHAVDVTPPSVRAGSAEFCVNSHGDETNAGNSILVKATNTIVDTSVTPNREATVEATCAGAGESLCEQSSSSFCPGGFIIRVPLGHGENRISLQVNNNLAAEEIHVIPFNVDLKGPSLCVRYLKDSGSPIADVDNKVLLASEADSVMVDVTIGACGSDPEVVTATSPEGCDPENPPDCGTSPVCLQKNAGRTDAGVPNFLAMCEETVGGNKHYRARYNDLRFPINSATVKAVDDIGNQTVDTHTFGYGDVRPLFNNEGRFDLKQAVVPNGLGGFVPEEFVQNELKTVILKALNSEKFKTELFPQLLDPRQPGDEEIACLRALENDVGCSYNHLASREQVVAIKPLKGGGDGFQIDSLEIPSLYFLNNNRLRLQLKVKGMHGRAEMYTMQFIDSDNDSIVDTEDDDADNDGICDKYVTPFGDCTDADHDNVCDEEIVMTGSRGKGLNASAKCILDKTIEKQDCPDVDAGDEDYFGCSDQDDDNDGVPDESDLPGRLITDTDYGTYILPIKFTLKELALNLEVEFQKDAEGRLRLNIKNVPGRSLAEGIGDGRLFIDFDCGRDKSELFQGGSAGQTGNGKNLWIDSEACNGLKSLNNTLVDIKQNCPDLAFDPSCIERLLAETSFPLGLGIDFTKRKFQDTNRQLVCTLEAIGRCSTPKRLEATLDKLGTDKLMAASVKVLDHRFHMDLYAPLGKADVTVDSRGLGFKAGGLLVPAGISDPDDTAERNATDFLNALPVEFRTEKFGPLSPAFDDEPVDPIEAAFQMGSETNLAVAEETVNSVLHSAGVLIWDLARREGDAHQMLDIDAKRIREKFDMATPERGDPEALCRDKNGAGIEDGFNSYKCFPYTLDVQQIFGEFLNYMDFNGDGVVDPNVDTRVPLLLRAAMNPLSPPTVRVVSVSPVQTWDGSSSPSHPAIVMAELEIAMGSAPMSVFEEQVENWSADVIRGTGEVKSWCDGDRSPGMNSEKCGMGGKLPIAVFNTGGRIFVTALLSVKDPGIIRAEAGISSVEGDGETLQTDSSKTYFNISMLENNTIVPDQDLVNLFQQNVTNIIGNYLFGSVRDIRLNIPAQLPLEAYCSVYREASPDLCACVADPNKDDCDLAHSVQDLWRQLDIGRFGIEGVRLDQTLLGVTSDDLGPRYMTIGTGVTIKLAD